MNVVINYVLPPVHQCSRRGDVLTLDTVSVYMCNSCDIYRSWVKCKCCGGLRLYITSNSPSGKTRLILTS